MKTKEELSALKEEVETLRDKLSVLSEEELEQVSGGMMCLNNDCGSCTKTDCKRRKVKVIF